MPNSRSRWTLVLALTLPFSLLLADGAAGQLDERFLEELGPNSIIDADSTHVDLDRDRGFSGFSLLGNAHFRGKGVEIYADAVGVAVLGTDPESRDRLLRIVAVGNIIFLRGRQVIRCETAVYETGPEKGVFTGVRLRLDIDFVGRARKALQRVSQERDRGLIASLPPDSPVHIAEEKGRIIFAARALTVTRFREFFAEDVEVTSCDFGDPHWSVGGKTLLLTAEGPDSDDGDEETPPTTYFGSLDGAFLEAAGLKIPVPTLALSSAWTDSIPLRSVSYSSSSKFGHRVDTVWDGNLLVPRSLDETVKLDILLDALSDRGTGVGAEVDVGERPINWERVPEDMNWLDFDHYTSGIFYAINDRGVDRNGVPPETNDRNRLRVFHRSLLPTGTYVDFEIATERDANFMREYFESEVRNEKAPENLIYLRQPIGEDTLVTLLAKKRGVPYRTVVERLPELTVHLVEKPLGTSGFRADVTARGSQLRFLPANTLPLNSRRLTRGDLLTVISYPVGRSELFKVRPFFETRFTAYEEDEIRGNAIERLALATGARWGTHLWRVFEPEGGFLGFSRLNHVIDPEISYRIVFENNVDPLELFPFDGTEAVDRFERLRFGTRTHLWALPEGIATSNQTERTAEEVALDPNPQPSAARKLAEARVFIDYFPDPRRDNVGDRWGPVDGEILLWPTRHLGLFADGLFEVEKDGRFDEINTGIRYRQRDATLVLANRFRRHLSHSFILSGRWKASEKYEVDAFLEYDIRRHTTANQEYSIIRNFHRWACVFSVEVDEGERDNVSVSINFGPRGFLNSLRSREDRRRDRYR